MAEKRAASDEAKLVAMVESIWEHREELARMAQSAGEVPVGAVIVKDGAIVGTQDVPGNGGIVTTSRSSTQRTRGSRVGAIASRAERMKAS